MRSECPFQIRPGLEFVVELRSSCLDLCQVRANDFFRDIALGSEMMIELLPCDSRSSADFANLRGPDAFLMEKVCGRRNDSKSGLNQRCRRALHEVPGSPAKKAKAR